MRKTTLILTAIILQLLFFPCMSQETEDIFHVPYGLKQAEWIKVQKIWTRNNHPVMIKKSDRTSLSGQILFIQDNKLVLWTDTASFIVPYADEGQILTLDQDSIISISANPELIDKLITSRIFWGTAAGAAASTALFFIGGGWISPVIVMAPTIAGTAVGAISGNKHKEGTKTITLDMNSGKGKNNYVLFFSGPGRITDVPAVVPGFVPEKLSDATFSDLMRESLLIKKAFGLPRLSFSWQTGFAAPGYSNNKYLITGGFAFNIRPSDRFIAGFHTNTVGSLEAGLLDFTDNSAGLSFYENLSYSSYTLHFQYIPLCVSRFLTNRFEVAAGAGASLNQMLFSTSILDVPGGNVLLAGEEVKEYTMGLEIISDIDFYILKHFSLNISVRKSFSKSARPGNLTAESPVSHEIVTFETIDADLSSFNLIFGLRIHFL